ncbi:MAG: copper-binding protein [Rhodocyclales bacterium]|nr:copper-binding protein [Rhodocyclales bacterium]
MKRILAHAAVGGALLSLVPAYAADHDHHPAATAPAALTTGVIKKIGKSGSEVTLAHGPIENLGMTAMTMAFKVKERKLLAALKVGDKVRFFADYIGGELVVVRIEAAK